MKHTILLYFSFLLFCTSAYAERKFANFVGSYEVIGQECRGRVNSSGGCNLSISADKVRVENNGDYTVVDILNPFGRFGAFKILDVDTQSTESHIAVTTSWSYSDIGATVHNLQYHKSEKAYDSWSLTIERHIGFLKLIYSHSGSKLSLNPPTKEKPSYTLYLKSK